MRLLRLEALTRLECHAVLPVASHAISCCGSWITQHQVYGDVTAVLSLTLPAAPLRPAGQALSGPLHLIFSAGSGNLKPPVPAFH